MTGIWRSFGSNVALRGVDFSLVPGEVHAMLGENGAGKSTLMRILAGILPADSGHIALDGAELTRKGRDRIAMVHQHFMLVPTMTVTDNVMLGSERGVVSGRRARAVEAELSTLAEQTGLAVRPRVRVEDLSVGEQQRVEILRALRRGARFLILDEPTANLAPTEVTALLARLRSLARDHGIAIAVITHHLDEVMEAADRVTVLRDGQRVASMDIAEATPAALARLMVGRDVDLDRRLAATRPPAATRLRLDGVSTTPREHAVTLTDIDLSVRAGEIVAVAGVDGNGQAELEDVVSGLADVERGCFTIDGQDVTGAPPKVLHDAGLNTIPGDRYRRGLVAGLGVDTNLVLDRFQRAPVWTRWGLSRTAIERRARAVIERMRIAAPTPRTPAVHLSGGHAQRVVLGRVLEDDLAVLVASQPTRGLDVGATEFVWANLTRLRDAGSAVLLISSDLEEVLSLADRVVVVYRGRIAARFDTGPFERADVGAAMAGTTAADAAEAIDVGDVGDAADAADAGEVADAGDGARSTDPTTAPAEGGVRP